MRDGLFVLVFCGPDRYLIPFGSDVDDGAAHVVAVVVERLAHQTQELREQRTSVQRVYRRAVGAFDPRCYPIDLNRVPGAPYEAITPEDRTYRLQPEAIQVRSPLLLRQRYQPAAASAVPRVLPHGLDAVLHPQQRSKVKAHNTRNPCPHPQVFLGASTSQFPFRSAYRSKYPLAANYIS